MMLSSSSSSSSSSRGGGFLSWGATAATVFLIAASQQQHVVLADKDISYYNANMGNPNVNEKMYWQDADVVLGDISKFSGLYVKFHTCAWTEEEYDVDGEISENDYWYQGSVPPMAANAAYSLYGALKGETFNGCSKSTYINSFYTTGGYTDFVRAMSYGKISGFAAYSDDDATSSNYGIYSAQCQADNNGLAYGVGCDSTYGFTLNQYSGNECNPKYRSSILDNMSNLNSAFKAVDCVQIYNSYNWVSYDYSLYGKALELLVYSKACSVMNYWAPDGKCPDPYGQLSYYMSNYNKGIKKEWADPYTAYNEGLAKGKELLIMGGMLMATALLLWAMACVCQPREVKEATKDAYYHVRQGGGGYNHHNNNYTQPEISVQSGGPSPPVGYATAEAAAAAAAAYQQQQQQQPYSQDPNAAAYYYQQQQQAQYQAQDPMAAATMAPSTADGTTTGVLYANGNPSWHDEQIPQLHQTMEPYKAATNELLAIVTAPVVTPSPSPVPTTTSPQEQQPPLPPFVLGAAPSEDNSDAADSYDLKIMTAGSELTEAMSVAEAAIKAMEAARVASSTPAAHTAAMNQAVTAVPPAAPAAVAPTTTPAQELAAAKLQAQSMEENVSGGGGELNASVDDIMASREGEDVNITTVPSSASATAMVVESTISATAEEEQPTVNDVQDVMKPTTPPAKKDPDAEWSDFLLG